MHMREAAFALGKTRIATIRRVLLPSVRSNIATGVTLGVRRLIGDTAIVVLLLGKTLHIETQGSTPVLGLLRGTGSSLTSYVYDNSPAGEGAAPQKAYAAAFVLLLFVLGLNLLVGGLVGAALAAAVAVVLAVLSLRLKGLGQAHATCWGARPPRARNTDSGVAGAASCTAAPPAMASRLA